MRRYFWLIFLVALPLAAMAAQVDGGDAEGGFNAVGTALSILPPLVAILGALVFRQVVVALTIGIWLGAWLITGDLSTGWFTGFFRVIDTYVLQAVSDPDNAAVLLFTLMIGGVVGIIQKNGGTKGIVRIVTSWAKTARRGQLATTLLATAIFFDDYANTLVVGGTMRPITDRLRISREKLAYLVDSTAAPMAAIALVTTWIGIQLGYIGAAIAPIEAWDETPYSIFLNALPYSFYPILALAFVYMIAVSSRDFGPMLKAEKRARTTGQVYSPDSTIAQLELDINELEPKEGVPPRLINAVLPIAVLVVGVISGLFITGEGDTVMEIIGTSDSYLAMMWASIAAAFVAVALTVGQRILSLEETIEAWYIGVKTMMLAIVILVLAWSLGQVNTELDTAGFMIDALSDQLHLSLLPVLVFILAAVVAFATGTSWGTMGILFPLVIPLAWGMIEMDPATDISTHGHILYASIASVLSGAVWGDHSSPISDTSILSSLASQCDLSDHIRTQMPYAGLVGLVAIMLGLVPIGFGVPWWVCLPLAGVVLWLILRFVGEEVPDYVGNSGA